MATVWKIRRVLVLMFFNDNRTHISFGNYRIECLHLHLNRNRYGCREELGRRIFYSDLHIRILKVQKLFLSSCFQFWCICLIKLISLRKSNVDFLKTIVIQKLHSYQCRFSWGLFTRNFSWESWKSENSKTMLIFQLINPDSRTPVSTQVLLWFFQSRTESTLWQVKQLVSVGTPISSILAWESWWSVGIVQ